jgi:hypothetical protein
VHDSILIIAITFAKAMLLVDDVVVIFVDGVELSVVSINMISHMTCHDG